MLNWYNLKMIKTIVLSLAFLCAANISYAGSCAHHEAVSLIRSWQLRQARELAEEEKIDCPAVMGLLEFYSGNYSLAHSYLESGGLLSGQVNEEMFSIIENTYRVTQNFEEMETERVIIRYSGKDKIVALYLNDIMERAVKSLEERLNWQITDKLIIEIYPDRQSFMTASTLTEEHIKVSGAVGICKFNRMMIVSPRVLQFGYRWPDTAVHELVHLFVGRISANSGIPLWLNEGFATNLEEIWRKDISPLKAYEINHLAEGIQSREWVELDKMKYGMPTLDSRAEVALAFAQVKSMTRTLAEIYGWDKLASYLYKTRSTNRAFEESFGLSENEFKEIWKEELEKSGIKPLAGAADPVFSFADDPVSAVAQWVSETAVRQLSNADRLADRGRHDLAVRIYSDALRNAPGNSVILHRMGRSYAELGDYEHALESFIKAVERNPSYPPPYIHAARIYMQKRNWEAAKDMLREYIYRIPFNPEARAMLQQAALQSGDDYTARIESRIIKILNEN